MLELEQISYALLSLHAVISFSGAALHMHDLTVGSADFVAFNLTKMDNLYSCMFPDDHLMFRFFESAPIAGCTESSNWTSVSDMIENASSKSYIDQWFHSRMSMFTTTPEGNNFNFKFDLIPFYVLFIVANGEKFLLLRLTKSLICNHSGLPGHKSSLVLV